MTQDKPLLGIGLMLIFCLMAPFGDAVAKMIGERVALGEMLLVRFAVQALALVPIIAVTGRAWRMSGRVLALTFVRTLLHVAAIGFMFTALQYLPLADAVAITFVMPFIMLVLGHRFLGEEVGHRRLIACIFGFLGTLLVVQPSFVEFGWPALLPLGVAVTFSAFVLITRQIAKDTDPMGLQAVSGVMATVMIIPVLLIGASQEIPVFELVQPDTLTWALLIGAGLLGSFAHLMMTWALRYAPAATLAPMQYLEIPFATFFGFIFFGDWPNQMATIGIAMTMTAGLFIVMRERSTAQHQEPEQSQEALMEAEAAQHAAE
ncbi:EamA/RhaT family transporter [Litorivita pollutaquae]|uniref:EamA/RhaT family transporter n=1 Tax=Litorivita pollutaquae TaxID=2200892 RepID=A0A2V4NUX5_9RHOB|nr:DMT family transporter [Litorivita pollutaquae]OUS21105.1 EamA family transporter [Rhodobacterales bacterium 59_46_T64]PYC48826.1 EamA/RhaT family transporter [Litorivita pollutaquae]